MPWWVAAILVVVWGWSCFQTYRGVRFGKVRAHFGDLAGRWNPLFWIVLGIYAFGTIYLPAFLILTVSR